MFPRSYFGGRFFAPRYWPQSQGMAPEIQDVRPICAGIELSPRLGASPDLEPRITADPDIQSC